MAIRKIFVISHVFLKKNYYQIVRFIISGLIATAVNFMVFNYIFLISDNLFLASSFGYSFGLLMSFIFSCQSRERCLNSFFVSPSKSSINFS